MEKEKDRIIDQIIDAEENANDVPTNKIDGAVDDAKEIAGKAIDFAGDAAKVAVGFAGDQLKNAKSIFNKVSKNISDGISRKNIEKYGPIFPDKLEGGNIKYPRMIDVVEYDKQMDVDECKGAIGFERTIKDVDLLGIYQKDASKFEGIDFYPDKKPSASIYYVHPLNDKQYIEITEYFKYLKEQRVSELEYIAQELGAKHFKVQILEETLASETSKSKADSKLSVKKDKAGVKVENEEKQKTFEYIGIAAENTYPGKEPREPQLKLWANNESIKSLVKQRLSSDNPLQSKTFRLDYNTSSGIKEKEAAKIDGVLKILKFSAAGNIQKEAQKESKRRLEYTIEF